jgi:hypothetical protein
VDTVCTVNNVLWWTYKAHRLTVCKRNNTHLIDIEKNIDHNITRTIHQMTNRQWSIVVHLYHAVDVRNLGGLMRVNCLVDVSYSGQANRIDARHARATVSTNAMCRK